MVKMLKLSKVAKLRLEAYLQIRLLRHDNFHCFCSNLSAKKLKMKTKTDLYRLQQGADGIPVTVDALFKVFFTFVLVKEN